MIKAQLIENLEHKSQVGEDSPSQKDQVSKKRITKLEMKIMKKLMISKEALGIDSIMPVTIHIKSTKAKPEPEGKTKMKSAI